MGYFFVALTIVFTVYGQLVLKWQVDLAGGAPVDAPSKLAFLIRLLVNPWVISGLLAAFAASLCWMLALSRMPLSSAYPLTSVGFLLILLFSVVVLGEPFGFSKLLGTLMIIGGIVVLTLEP